MINGYLLAYTGIPGGAPDPAGQVEVLGQVVNEQRRALGQSGADLCYRHGNADADQATDPAMAYDPERDQFRIVWRADETEADFEVFTRRVGSNLIDPGGFTVIQVSTAGGDTADDPVIAHLPDQDR